MQIGYMISNNLILFIVFSFTIVWGFAFNLKKKGKCKLHVNLPVIPSTEALPGGGDPMLLVWISKYLVSVFLKTWCRHWKLNENPLSLLEFYRRWVEVHYK